jgi:hypothetical protein
VSARTYSIGFEDYDAYKTANPDDIYAEAPEDTRMPPIHDYTCRCCGHRGCSSRPESYCVPCERAGCLPDGALCERKRGAA